MEVTKNMAIGSMAWNAVQVWGAKIVTLALFFGVARLLDPNVFGVVSASALVLYLITLVSDFGYGDAIIQRKNLSAEDLTLPFVSSLAGALFLAALAWFNSGPIALLIGVPQLDIVLRAMCPVAPLTCFLLFQEAMYKRELAFKTLALRSISANLAGGGVAIVAAFLGAGVWSLVLQAYVVLAVSIVWLWRRPQWRIIPKINLASFHELTKFGRSIVSSRALDFLITRSIELLIGWKFGPVALGFYAVSSRLYYTLLELLQGWLSGVLLSLIVRFQSELGRLQTTYRASIAALAALGMPIFWALALISDELVIVLAGPQWAEAGELLGLLLFLGGVQCVQFINATYLAAMGEPHFAVRLNLTKLVALTIGLLCFPTDHQVDVVRIYVVAQLAATPLSFFWASKSLRLSMRAMCSDVAAPVVGCVCAALVTWFLKPLLGGWIDSSLALAVATGCLFLVLHVMVLSLDAMLRLGSSIRRIAAMLPKAT